ncbi:MAG: phosphoribosyltransferase family protein [Bdellovibrionales bacterium]
MLLRPKSFYIQLPQSGKKVKVFSLIQWNQFNDHFVRELVLSQKNSYPLLLPIESDVQKFVLKRHSWKNVFIVPCPAHQGPDHAEALAHSLASLSRRPMLQPLKRGSHKEQKTKGRQQRQATSMKWINKSSIFKEEPNVLFVDDIVTTGSTVEAAYHLFQERSCCGFDVFCLAYRQRRGR